MFVSLVITPFYDFASVRFVLLFGCVREETDVVMDVKVEQGTRFATGFVDYEIVERIVLSLY